MSADVILPKFESESLCVCVSVAAGSEQTWANYRASFARGLSSTGEINALIKHFPCPLMHCTLTIERV